MISQILADLQQPRLRTREAALATLLETKPLPPTGETLPLLLSSPFAEKSWLASIVAACCALTEDHCAGNESSVGEVLSSLEAEFQRSRTLQKSVLIGRILSEGRAFQGVVALASGRREHYHQLRRLYLAALEYALLNHAPTYEHLEKKAIALFKPTFPEFFDPSYVSTLGITALAVVARLLLASKYSNDEFRSTLTEELAKKTITAKTPAPRGVLGMFGLFPGSLSQSEFEKNIEGPLCRMAKKSPEAASDLVATGHSFSPPLLRLLLMPV